MAWTSKLSSKYLVNLYLNNRLSCFYHPESYSSDPAQYDPHARGATYFGNSRVSSTSRRSGRNRHHSSHRSGRRHHDRRNRHHDRSNSRNSELSLTNSDLNELGSAPENVQFGGREYAIGGRRIITTKTTKTTKTAYGSDGSVRVLPGSTKITTYTNSSSYASPLHEYDDDTLRLQNAVFSSSHSTGSSGSFSSSSSAYAGDHFSVGEEEVFEYEEEEYDPLFDRGIQFSAEDKVHPLERLSWSNSGICFAPCELNIGLTLTRI